MMHVLRGLSSFKEMNTLLPDCRVVHGAQNERGGRARSLCRRKTNTFLGGQASMEEWIRKGGKEQAGNTQLKNITSKKRKKQNFRVSP